MLSSCFLALWSHSLRLHAFGIHLSKWKTCRYIVAAFRNLVRKRARKRTFCLCYISNLLSRALHKVLNLPPACGAILSTSGLFGLDRGHLIYYWIVLLRIPIRFKRVDKKKNFMRNRSSMLSHSFPSIPKYLIPFHLCVIPASIHRDSFKWTQTLSLIVGRISKNQVNVFN